MSMNIGTALTAGVTGPLAAMKPAKNSDQKISDAAKQFEAMLLNQLLQSSHAFASDDDGADQNSSLADLGQQQFAQALTARGGLGIAKMVVAGLNHDANR